VIRTIVDLRRINVPIMSESETMFFKSSIDIPEDTRTQVVEVLNLRLADAVDLKTQAKPPIGM